MLGPQDGYSATPKGSPPGVSVLTAHQVSAPVLFETCLIFQESFLPLLYPTSKFPRVVLPGEVWLSRLGNLCSPGPDAYMHVGLMHVNVSEPRAYSTRIWVVLV